MSIILSDSLLTTNIGYITGMTSIEFRILSDGTIDKYVLLKPEINQRYYISARYRTTTAQVQNKYT